jgi:hypothetical protein
VDANAIQSALAEPFEPDEVKFKPQAVKGNRAMAIGYVDARVIQDRLDEVLGVDGWQDEYQTLADGSVVCQLRLKIGGEWITKTDVGSPSEQPDGGDRLKAAFSDALKRAAVKFGIGRYLYRLPAQWADYDPVRRQFTAIPQLPAFARPKPRTTVRDAPAVGPAPAKQLAAAPADRPALPATGKELAERLKEYDGKLARAGRIKAGQLVTHVQAVGIKAGYPADVENWPAPAIKFAADVVKDYEKKLPAAAGK